MAEEITNVEATATQQQEVVNEVNTAETQPTQEEVKTEETTNPVENSNEEAEQTEVGGVQETKPEEKNELSYDELKAKLDEYQVRDEEERAFKERLGLGDVDQQTYNLMNVDQQIVNDGKQSYLRLCNEYGIDADPSKIDKSIEALRETDPKRAYEFQRLFENLGQDVSAKRQMVRNTATAYDVQKFSNDYNRVLQASPALNNVMAQYVREYSTNSDNMYGELKSVMDILVPVYQEAFNAGKKYIATANAKKDTSAVQGGVATANTNTYSSGGLFTREQISKMSPEEFAKNEKAITQQMLEGKL